MNELTWTSFDDYLLAFEFRSRLCQCLQLALLAQPVVFVLNEHINAFFEIYLVVPSFRRSQQWFWSSTSIDPFHSQQPAQSNHWKQNRCEGEKHFHRRQQYSRHCDRLSIQTRYDAIGIWLEGLHPLWLPAQLALRVQCVDFQAEVTPTMVWWAGLLVVESIHDVPLDKMGWLRVTKTTLPFDDSIVLLPNSRRRVLVHWRVFHKQSCRAHSSPRLCEMVFERWQDI